MPRFLLPFIFAAVLLPATASAQPLERQNRVYYSNIAPGELENEFIKAFPTRIMFLSETGKLYGGVYVRIFDASGIAVFKKMCEKPWLYVKLPQGDYNIVAVDRHKITRVKSFYVGKEGSKQVKIEMKWPETAVGY